MGTVNRRLTCTDTDTELDAMLDRLWVNTINDMIAKGVLPDDKDREAE